MQKAIESQNEATIRAEIARAQAIINAAQQPSTPTTPPTTEPETNSEIGSQNP